MFMRVPFLWLQSSRKILQSSRGTFSSLAQPRLVELLEWNDWYGTCQKMSETIYSEGIYIYDLGKYTLDILNNVYYIQ